MIATLLTAAVLSQGFYSPQEAQAVFAQAGEAFYKEPPDYEQAKQGYLKLLEHGFDGPDVLFNLGTTCLAQGDLGHAVLYLERAHRLSRDGDIEANLQLARSRQGDQVIGGTALEAPFVERFAESTDGSLFGDAPSGPLTIDPANKVVDVTYGQPPPTVAYTAKIGAAVVPASFAIDRGEIGSIGAGSGVFTRKGTLGGKATITATYAGQSVSTSVTVFLHMTQNGGTGMDRGPALSNEGEDPA